jgi:cob(I)alamin adenosyltransferase
MRRGYIQVYTGDGKGKTTAALGLALRAAGAGLRVFIAQFIKKARCSEHAIVDERLKDLITVKQFGEGLILGRKSRASDAKAAQFGLTEVKKIIGSGQYDVVVLDEINVAVQHHLIDLADLLDIMEKKPREIELVITGRGANEQVIEKADLVTEMKDVKHYWEKKIRARRGIEW